MVSALKAGGISSEETRRRREDFIFYMFYFMFIYFIISLFDGLEHFDGVNCAVLCCKLSSIWLGMSPAQNCLYSATILLRWHWF